MTGKRMTHAEREAADVQVKRARRVKGWAFMDLSDEDNARIREYLATGDVDVLPELFRRVEER